MKRYGYHRTSTREIKKMHNEQTKFLKKTFEAVMYLYEEDSKKKK